MSELTTRQIEFFNELLKGRPVAAIVEDLEIHYKELRQWKADPLFTEELTAVNEYMQFLREMDIRIGATEALRRGRITVEGGNCKHWLSDRQRRVGKDLVQLAGKLDRSFRNHNSGPERTQRVRSVAIARRALGDAREVVERMERLRDRILEERRTAEGEARETKTVPAPARDEVAVRGPDAAQSPEDLAQE